MHKVNQCIALLNKIFENIEDLSLKDLDKYKVSLSKIESEADLIKNNIRTSLPKNFLFPIDRVNFLEILSLQDNLADCAEDIGILVSIKKLDFHKVGKNLLGYFQNSKNTLSIVSEIIMSFDALLESSFGGIPAEKVKIMIDSVSKKDHESKIMKNGLNRLLFNRIELPTPDFYIFMQVIEEIGKLTHYGDKLALRIGIILN